MAMSLHEYKELIFKFKMKIKKQPIFKKTLSTITIYSTVLLFLLHITLVYFKQMFILVYDWRLAQNYYCSLFSFKQYCLERIIWKKLKIYCRYFSAMNIIIFFMTLCTNWSVPWNNIAHIQWTCVRISAKSTFL